MDRNETFNLSRWLQLEEKSTKDGKEFFIFFVLFRLLQEIPSESPDVNNEMVGKSAN